MFEIIWIIICNPLTFSRFSSISLQWLCNVNTKHIPVGYILHWAIGYSILVRSIIRVTPRRQAVTHRQPFPLCLFSSCVNPLAPPESSLASVLTGRPFSRCEDSGSPRRVLRSLLSASSPSARPCRLKLQPGPPRARSRCSGRSARTSVAPVPYWSACAVRS